MGWFGARPRLARVGALLFSAFYRWLCWRGFTLFESSRYMCNNLISLRGQALLLSCPSAHSLGVGVSCVERSDMSKRDASSPWGDTDEERKQMADALIRYVTIEADLVEQIEGKRHERDRFSWFWEIADTWLSLKLIGAVILLVIFPILAILVVVWDWLFN